MYPSPQSDVRHRLAVLFSRCSRDTYAAVAVERGQSYTFTDAWGRPKRWLKGEYAYLAPNAACALLNRCNLKHDFLEESELNSEVINGYQALLVPNAAHLGDDTIDRIDRWLRTTDGRLVVTGKTNLPNALLGLNGSERVAVEGYTGWRWLWGSPFEDSRAWEECYVTGYRGYSVHRVGAGPGSRVLAELLEFGGDLSNVAAATKRPLGPAIVLTDRTVYVANQVFEFLGGALQLHLNVEDVRKWSQPTHWGDTIAFFLRQLLLEVGLGSLWDTRLRSFGSYDGVLSFRHDVHGDQEFAMLDYEVQNLIPATFDLEDPAVAENTKPKQVREWIRRTGDCSFIEQGLHNDAAVGDPPTAVHGTGLYDHVNNAEKNLGFPIFTCGRHGPGHMHPETIDAMDYLYANYDPILGMCTFSYCHMIEFGVRNPSVVARGKALTYMTDPNPTVATPAFWFPYHPVVTTDGEWRVLRGWDRTHDFDCDYDLLDTIFSGHNARIPGVEDQLENPVYSLQYHPENAEDPASNDGRGTLGYLRHAIDLAAHRNFWVANQRQLYQRMADYQDLALRLEDGGNLMVHNPTSRPILGMAIERRQGFGSVWDGSEELVHVVRGRVVTLPPLAPGERKTVRFDQVRTGGPKVLQPNHEGLTILDARHDHGTHRTRLRVSVCRGQRFRLEDVSPEGRYRVQIDGEPERELTARIVYSTRNRLNRKEGTAAPNIGVAVGSGALVFLPIDVNGKPNSFVERTITIVRA